MWLHKNPKLSKIIEDYLQNSRLAPSTVKLTRHVWGQIIEMVGDIRVNKFTADTVSLVQVSWLRRLKVNGVRIYRKSASPILSYCVEKGYIKSNPFFEVKAPKAVKRVVRVYTPAEFRRMLEACRDVGDPLGWTLTLLLARTTGMRKSAIQNLTRGDIDFENETITVREKFDTDKTWPWQAKDREERTLPLVPAVANVLTERLFTMPTAQPYLLIKPPRYYHLIERKEVGMLTDEMRLHPVSNFDRIFCRIKKKAGVSGRFHDFKSTCLSGLADDLDLREVMQIGGHSDIKTTMVYVEAGQSPVNKARESVNRAMRACLTPSQARYQTAPRPVRP